MISTGLQKLDEYLGGGIPEGKSVLFQIEPGMKETDIGFHIMKANIDKFKAIYISSKSSPKNVYKSFEEFGFFKSKNFILIDGYSSLIGAPSDEKYIVEEPHDIRSYEDIISEIMYEINEKMIIVFDSISNIMDLCKENKALEGIERINKEIEKKNSFAIYNFISWPYKEGVLYKLKRIFNAIIEVKQEKYPSMHIKKIDWDGKVGRMLYFKIFKPEGIKIYIPKILLVGPFKSGKTTFLKAISKNFVPVERLGATVGVEYGMVDYKGYRAELFGIPGREEFMPLLEKLGGSSMGAIILIDSTNPYGFDSAKKLIKRFENMPYVIVANKQDLPNALPEEEIRRRLQISYDVPIIKTIAIDGKGVYEAFEILVDKIMEWLNVS